MPGMQSIARRMVLPGALVLVAVVAAPELSSAQGSGPAAHYSPSYTDASWGQIFESHRSWGNAIPGAQRSPNGLWCVHPDHRVGEVLEITANGKTIYCTVGDMVQAHHVAQWRSRWVVELSWSAFVALDLNRRNVVDSVRPAGVGGAGPAHAAAADANAPSTQYFPETGHTVGHGFLNYWRSNGGLSVFGYPLSDEFEENGLVTQYFERAVFEFHPGNPPSHRVLLRRLGVGAASEVRHTEPFQPLDWQAAGGARYFEQTGQSIANRFIDYWNNRGGLAIFGYPISQKFEQDGRTVQYFERSVFEWHPENPEEHQVLLRRLGYEALRQGNES